MASPPKDTPKLPEKAIEHSHNKPSLHLPKPIYQLSEDEATGRPISSMERKLKAFLNSQAVRPGRPPSGAVAPAGVYKGPNPGGPMIQCDIPDIQDEQSLTGKESGDTRDVTARSGELSGPRTAIKMGEEKEEVARESASRVEEREMPKL